MNNNGRAALYAAEVLRKDIVRAIVQLADSANNFRDYADALDYDDGITDNLDDLIGKLGIELARLDQFLDEIRDDADKVDGAKEG